MTAILIIGVSIAIALLVFKIVYDIKKSKQGNEDSSEKQDVGDLIEKELEHNKENFNLRMDAFDEKITNRIQPLESYVKTLNENLSQFKEKSEKNQGAFQSQMQNMTDSLKSSLQEQTKLNQILGNPSKRGNWGEKMAEDVLRSVGFMKGINYYCQQAIENPVNPTAKLRPDYTFPLPENMVLFMDVKFPFDNYQRVIQLESGIENNMKNTQALVDEATKSFIRDVRHQIDSLHEKQYINAKGSVDQMLMFIPNESIFRFLAEKEPTIIEYGLSRNVTLCSPVTLFSILSIIRESVQIAQLRESTDQVLEEHKNFMAEWEKFKGAMDKLGERIDRTQADFGKLVGTRTNQLERPIKRIQNLQSKAQSKTVGLNKPTEIYELEEIEEVAEIAEFEGDEQIAEVEQLEEFEQLK